MSDSRPKSDLRQTLATHSDVTRILGDMDDATAVEILDLHPTVADLDAASMWITGDDDIATRESRPRASIIARIVEILAIADEEEPEPPPR